MTPLPAPVPAPGNAGLPAVSDAEIATARGYAEASRAPSTRRAYETDWRSFSAWCRDRGLQSLPAPPAAVVLWLSAGAAAGLSASTIGRRLAAIGYHHRRAGHPPPQQAKGGTVIGDVVAGIRRSRASPPIKKTAADADVVRDILRTITGDSLREVRDRALIAIGFAAALRRSELVAILVEDISKESRGIRLTIRTSKTDQDRQGQEIAIPEGRRIRPVALLDAWLARAAIAQGFIFRRIRAGQAGERPLSDRTVARIGFLDAKVRKATCLYPETR